MVVSYSKKQNLPYMVTSKYLLVNTPSLNNSSEIVFKSSHSYTPVLRFCSFREISCWNQGRTSPKDPIAIYGWVSTKLSFSPRPHKCTVFVDSQWLNVFPFLYDREVPSCPFNTSPAESRSETIPRQWLRMLTFVWSWVTRTLAISLVFPIRTWCRSKLKTFPSSSEVKT